MDESAETVEQTTAEEQQSEEQTLDETSSTEQSEDITSEETIETPEVKRPSRAQERIRDLIREKKELERQLQTRQTDTLEGVTEDGIDPQIFAQSVLQKAAQQSQSTATAQIQALQAEQEFPELKTSKIFQTLAKGYVMEGYSPYEAAMMANEDYQEEVKATNEKAAKKVQADKTLRSATYTPTGTQQNKADHVFTDAEIAAMDHKTYEANRKKIFKQQGIK